MSAPKEARASGRRRKPRRRRMVTVLIVVVFVALLAETALVIGVFVSPKAATSLREVAASIDRGWNGDEHAPGLRTRAARWVGDGYRSWIEPLWSGPNAPAAGEEFPACVTCHQDYASTRRFSSVYMNHPLHAQLDVACATCHPQNTHPDPPRPVEKACATCHDVTDRTQCATCHPPGSLPHFYLLGAPRQQAVECSVCHPSTSFFSKIATPKVSGTFTGKDPSFCLQCHASTAGKAPTCTSCHQPGHPPDWVSRHGYEAGEAGLNDCYTCHTGTWCGTRCHSVTSTNPTGKQPLPDLGVPQ